MSYFTDEPRFARDTIVEDLSPYHSLYLTCEAEMIQGETIKDTRVVFELDGYHTTWNNRRKLAQELAEVLRKYII